MHCWRNPLGPFEVGDRLLGYTLQLCPIRRFAIVTGVNEQGYTIRKVETCVRWVDHPDNTRWHKMARTVPVWDEPGEMSVIGTRTPTDILWKPRTVWQLYTQGD